VPGDLLEPAHKNALLRPSRNTSAAALTPSRRPFSVDPSWSDQTTGISTMFTSRAMTARSSSTSKANPVTRRSRMAARAVCAVKNLQPHWLSSMPGRIRRAISRNTAPPRTRLPGCGSASVAPPTCREPMTAS
jgi:hypothetical protein